MSFSLVNLNVTNFFLTLISMNYFWFYPKTLGIKHPSFCCLIVVCILHNWLLFVLSSESQISLKVFFLFQALLVGIGLQHKTIEDLEKDIDLPISQLLGLYNRILRKVVQVSVSHFMFISFSSSSVKKKWNCPGKAELIMGNLERVFLFGTKQGRFAQNSSKKRESW